MKLLLENLSCHLGVEIEYSEIPPVELNAEWTQLFDLSIPQFAAKERKCKQGNFPCGGRCISGKAKRKDGSPVQCRKMLPGQSKIFAEFLKAQGTDVQSPNPNRIVLRSGVADVPISELNLDPSRFQYKLAHGATGSSGSLSGVRKWDDNLAGIVQAWQDPRDGKTYVINGHNRVNLAKQLGVDELTVKYIKADSAEEARAIGALTNIAEGRGNELDAAKFFRDTGLQSNDLQQKGIPLRERIALDGLALSQLSDGLFTRVAIGEITADRGVAIGSLVKDHKQQSELVDLIEQQEKRGKRIGIETIQELADMVANAPRKEEEQGLLGLLGFQPEQRSLVVEKAALQSDVKKRLSREKRLFGIVSKAKAVEDLEQAGNRIDVEKSRGISKSADIALKVFDQEKNLTGDVSNILNQSAQRIANGENAKRVKDEAYKQILAKLQETFTNRENSSSG